MRRGAALMAAAASALVIAGCTVDGTPVADPAAPSTSTTTYSSVPGYSGPSYPTPSYPTKPPSFAPPPDDTVREVPAPANWATMTCREYIDLDLSTQVAVIKALGATRNFVPVARIFSVLCTGQPETTVADMLRRGGPN
ncbi:hypothetical protein QSJ19_07990 [Gordonia sp. ABSL11-1]|uniref:hypothetical protein n=1 Tax=Gordonia sp. ABSL11-1 TaxID=3053924 RepID=UPI0025734152|nr:hypothetical protein [Gordonia sp. ABSL11-1]MDL9945533.1 hypothetical protein [Gordonia sp. ABSL11-1]